MNQKYLGATVVLPLATATKLEELRDRLTDQLGFEPSRAETVAFLIQFYEKSSDKQTHGGSRSPLQGRAGTGRPQPD